MSLLQMNLGYCLSTPVLLVRKYKVLLHNTEGKVENLEEIGKLSS